MTFDAGDEGDTLRDLRRPADRTLEDEGDGPTVPGFVARRHGVTRGMNARACIAWVRTQHGDGGIRALADALPRGTVADLGGPSLRPAALAWVPFRSYVRLLVAVDARFGAGDLTLLHHVGGAMARRDLPALTRRFARLLTPGVFVDRIATKLWRFYNAHGSWTTSGGRGRHDVRGVLSDRPDTHAAFCASTAGWIEGALLICGAQEARVVEETCASRRQDTVCTFHATWRGP